MKFSWIGPWASKINWCEGHWFSSTYMVVRLSDISSKQPKNTKNTFFVSFWAYVGQPYDLISWAVPMSFASINSNIPRTDPWEFHEKILRIGGAGKRGLVVSRIGWCEGHWNVSTYMVVRLSNISSKTDKKCVFCVFRLFVGQPHDHTSWAKLMPFALIISTNPRNHPWEFHEKILRIGGAGKWGFFEAAILKFF